MIDIVMFSCLRMTVAVELATHYTTPDTIVETGRLNECNSGIIEKY